MKLTRRNFTQILSVSGLATILYPVMSKAENKSNKLEKEIINLFSSLPEQKAFQILILKDNIPSLISLNPNIPLFCGSSFKVYILTEFLRQMEQQKVTLNDELSVDDSIRSLSSPVFGQLSGKTTAIIALQAMMMHSDNTATDLILNYISVKKVRQFIKEIALENTIIPDNTRIFFSYILGAQNNVDLGWEKISNSIDKTDNVSRKIINNQQTMLSSSADFIKFYQNALQGKYFQKKKTLQIFKRILSFPDIIDQFIPENAFGYVKGGSISFTPQYALSLAGGVRFTDNYWAYYSFLLNWEDETGELETKISNSFIKAISQTFQKIS